MTDLTDRLARLRTDASDAADSTIDSDLGRAHTARRRRRTRFAAIAAVPVVAAAAGGLAYLGTSGDGSHAPTAQRPATHSHSAAHSSQKAVTHGIKLVDYTGEQPHGFTLAQVPDGWVVQQSATSFLTIAKPGDHTPGSVFVNKLVVSLKSRDDNSTPTGTPVTVNGHPGKIRNDGTAAILEYSDGSHDLEIQCWDNLGWDNDQLVQFAQGVGVTKDAVQPRG